MLIMEALYYISLSVFLIYLLICYILFGVTRSISDTVYHWKEFGTLFPSAFTFFCWGAGFPLIAYWIEYSKTDLDFLPFIAIASLMFVGASPLFRNDDLEHRVHVFSASVCMIVSYVWAVLFGDTFLAIAFMLTSAFFIFIVRKKYVYWVEVLAFSHIFIQLKL